jgi:hypothetical protein
MFGPPVCGIPAEERPASPLHQIGVVFAKNNNGAVVEDPVPASCGVDADVDLPALHECFARHKVPKLAITNKSVPYPNQEFVKGSQNEHHEKEKTYVY